MPSLNPELLTAQAVRIVDSDGVDALTMRSLARSLGVDPMAAYRHLANKEALLDAVADKILSEVNLLGLKPGAEGVRELCRRVLAAIATHPKAAGILATRPWDGPAGFAIAEKALELAEPLADIETVAPMMNATGLFLIALAQAIHAGTNRPATQLNEVDPGRFPRLARLATTGSESTPYEAQLDLWLGALLAQWEHA